MSKKEQAFAHVLYLTLRQTKLPQCCPEQADALDLEAQAFAQSLQQSNVLPVVPSPVAHGQIAETRVILLHGKAFVHFAVQNDSFRVVLGVNDFVRPDCAATTAHWKHCEVMHQNGWTINVETLRSRLTILAFQRLDRVGCATSTSVLQPQLTVLSENLLAIIVSFLNARDLVALMQCSTLFCEASQQQDVWQQLVQSDFGEQVDNNRNAYKEYSQISRDRARRRKLDEMDRPHHFMRGIFRPDYGLGPFSSGYSYFPEFDSPLSLPRVFQFRPGSEDDLAEILVSRNPDGWMSPTPPHFFHEY